MAKRRTVITVETHSLIVMRREKETPPVWCAACEAETQMLTIEQAARIYSATERAIFRLVENRRVHFDETQAGQLLICAESLKQAMNG